ncbi:hypothetical protein L228DRAFT_245167 [Xylona heveae TC161]|uniref:Uncharacterized protein n=1 Tax=Xylona heveae (strain CBS 132557 / TC161) TaxID=1328760 RepID=A0A165I296_XYLHT|nr:hypothetical protein L228DRAFT_245167 [Xylona heveae TC161]KZF24261.1 hypothetical protein L228DRAFT_245167 [Xylona heveae TC161]
MRDCESIATNRKKRFLQTIDTFIAGFLVIAWMRSDPGRKDTGRCAQRLLWPQLCSSRTICRLQTGHGNIL